MNPYSNPYRTTKPVVSNASSSTSPSKEKSQDDHEVIDLLQQLSISISWNGDLVEKLQQQLQVRPPSNWSWSTMTVFLEWVFSSRLNELSSTKATVLLALVVEDFTEEQAYAAAVFCPENSRNNGNNNILLILASRLENKLMSISHQASLVALMTFWRALDRLESILTTNSTNAWWMTEPYFTYQPEMMVHSMQLFDSLENLRDFQDDSTPITAASLQEVRLRPERVQLAAISFLVHAQKYQSASLSSYESFTQKLYVLASRLCDRDMPRTSFTHLSLVCLQLLVPLEHQHALNAIFSVVIRATLEQQNHHHLPRWTEQREGLYKWTLGILLDWADHQHEVTDVTAVMAQQLWNRLLLTTSCGGKSSASSALSSSTPPSLFYALYFLVMHCRSSAREGLQLALQQHDDQQQASNAFCYQSQKDLLVEGIKHLISHLISDKSLGAFVLLNTLLQDGKSPLTNDHLSKSLWKALSVQDCLDVVNTAIQYTSSTIALDKGVNTVIQSALLHPKLHRLLDLLHLVLTQAEASIISTLVSNLSTQMVETVIQIMVPKYVCVDRANKNADDDSDDDESLTPMANNLSRIDTSLHKTFCVQEHESVPIGMEPTIRIAAATVLAVLGQWYQARCNQDHHADEESTRCSLLQSRMMDAVNSFVDELQLSFVMPGLEMETKSAVVAQSLFSHSQDMTRRRLRLLSSLATPENELYLAALLHGAQTSQRRAALCLGQEKSTYQRSLHEHQQREKNLETEKRALGHQLAAQGEALQQQMARFQRICTKNAKQLVQVHQMETSKAERRQEEALARIRDTRERLVEAEQELEASRRSEVEAKEALDKANLLTDELKISLTSSLERADTTARELNRVTAELRTSKTRVERMVRNEKKMRAHIQAQDESISMMDESQAAMKDSLESLFADMVSLVQLYESKEKEEESSREKEESTVEELTRKLHSERSIYAQLEEKYRQTEVNNNMLSSKYEKVRKLLEKEREERNNESARFAAEQRKRSGPASYMSHLHRSTSSSTDKSNERYRLVLSGEGKENNSSSSSSYRSSQMSTSSRRYK